MVEVNFHDQMADELLKFAVIIAKTEGKWVFCKHRERSTYEVPGGHREAGETILEAAKRELQEETGVKYAKLVSGDIFSLETLTVNGHMKKGTYVPSHLHFNVTYLAEAEESEELIVQEEENQAVKWWTFEEALKASTEPWMVERVYRKLMEKCR